MFGRVSNFIFASLAVTMVVANPLPQTTGPGSGQHHGTATWFLQGGVAGACGTVHQDSDHVVALQTTEYADGKHCGKTISITDSATGTTATGVIADECPGCGATNNIDLSEGLFEVFAPTSQGVITVIWEFV